MCRLHVSDLSENVNGVRTGTGRDVSKGKRRAGEEKEKKKEVSTFGAKEKKALQCGIR